MNKLLLHPAAKPVLFVLACWPLAHLLWGALANTLGANPAEALIRGTGDWLLRGLCLTLAITPLREMTGWSALLRLRRMLGLFAFFYGLLHFLAYAWLDMGLDPTAIVRDLGKRPFALIGFLAFVLLLPLALTSTDRAMRALGGRRWQRLHRLVYLIAPLGLLHLAWMRASKGRLAEIAPEVLALLLLLGLRWWRRPAPRSLD